MSTKKDFLAIIDKALKVRESGNEKFKQGDHPGALRDYYTVLLTLKGIDGRMQQAFPPKTKHVVVCEPKIQEVKEDEPSKEGDEEEDVYAIIKKAILNTYINSAAIHIKEQRWQRALDCSLDAQKIDEENPKAKFREAQARIGLGQISKGKAMLEQMQKTVGADAGIARTLAQLQADEKAKEKTKNAQLRGFLNKQKPSETESTSTNQSQAETAQTSSASTPADGTPASNTNGKAPITETTSSGTSDSTIKEKSDQISKATESVTQQIKDQVSEKQEAQTQTEDSEMKNGDI